MLTAILKAVQDAEKNHPHKDQVQRLIPITATIHVAATVAEVVVVVLLAELLRWALVLLLLSGGVC
jgi:hypothetical protein